MFKNQAEIVKGMTDRDLVAQVYITQAIILTVSIFIGMISFDSFEDFTALFKWDVRQIFVIGGAAGLFVVSIDFLLMKLLPKEQYDDGGINEKVFSNRPIWHIFLLTLLIGFSEEVLFRGILQTSLGYVSASILFAVLHFRYLTKWALLIVVLLLSFFIGWIFEVTGNLAVTIFAHFLIDFILGVTIHIQHLRKEKQS